MLRRRRHSGKYHLRLSDPETHLECQKGHLAVYVVMIVGSVANFRLAFCLLTEDTTDYFVFPSLFQNS